MALLMAGDAPLAEMATCPGSRLPYREPPPWMPQLPARQGSRDRGIEGGRAHASIKGNGVRTEGIAWKASVGVCQARPLRWQMGQGNLLGRADSGRLWRSSEQWSLRRRKLRGQS